MPFFLISVLFFYILFSNYFASFLIPNKETCFAPKGKICFNINLVTTTAVNKLTTTPTASTIPNPLTGPVPNMYNNIATANVVTLPSTTAAIAA